VLGQDVERMSEAALAAVAERATVFARVSPTQKHRIVLALKSHGHVVGFLGDGINDAPSLHAADVGISVVNAVDVAKESADIILGERSLAVLPASYFVFLALATLTYLALVETLKRPLMRHVAE
jgi:P-type Mg2+ transporter